MESNPEAAARTHEACRRKDTLFAVLDSLELLAEYAEKLKPVLQHRFGDRVPRQMVEQIDCAVAQKHRDNLTVLVCVSMAREPAVFDFILAQPSIDPVFLEDWLRVTVPRILFELLDRRLEGASAAARKLRLSYLGNVIYKNSLSELGAPVVVG